MTKVIISNRAALTDLHLCCSVCIGTQGFRIVKQSLIMIFHHQIQPQSCNSTHYYYLNTTIIFIGTLIIDMNYIYACRVYRPATIFCQKA